MSTNPKNEPEPEQVKAPEIDKVHELAKILADKMGLGHFQQEIDMLKETDKVFLQKLEEVINSQNQVVNSINQLTGTAQVQNQNVTTAGQTNNTGLQNFDISKLEVIGNIVDKVLDGYSKYKTATNPTPQTLIDPDYINEKIKNSVKGNFELGEAMIDSLKTKVVGKAMTKIVTDIVKHEPE